MNERVVVDLFVEDRAHEELLKPLVVRVAQEEEIEVQVRVRAARGGRARVIKEYRLYQDVAELGSSHLGRTDFLVVGIDGNCSTFADARDNIRRATVPTLADRLVVACPDPHIELWYLADPQSFEAVVGYRPDVGHRKCVRAHYKQVLEGAIQRGGHPPTLKGIEFASDLVDAMDLYRAGKTIASLKAFLDDFRAGLRRLRQGPGRRGGS